MEVAVFGKKMEGLAKHKTTPAHVRCHVSSVSSVLRLACAFVCVFACVGIPTVDRTRRLINLVDALSMALQVAAALATVVHGVAGFEPRVPAPYMCAEMVRLRGALDDVMPQLTSRLSTLGIESGKLADCLHSLPADDRDELLLAAAVRCVPT